jgi:predicted permease
MRIALSIIRAVTPAAHREFVVGDTLERLAEIERASGERAASHWLRREMWRVVVRAPRDLLSVRSAQRSRALYTRNQASRGNLLDTIRQDFIHDDLQQALRSLVQTKAWTAVVLLTLALGIGANTALFTGINGLLLRTVPVPNPDSLVRLAWAGQNDMMRGYAGYGPTQMNAAGEPVQDTISYPAYEALVAANETLTGLAAGAPTANVNIISDGNAELASAYLASGNYFEVLGVRAQLGRTFGPGDDTATAPPVAVISDVYWKRRFGADPNVSGKTVTAGRLAVTIIGVTPPAFTGIQRLMGPAPDVTIPLAMDREISGPRLQDGTNWWLQAFGRLKPGVTLQQVRGNLEGAFQGAAREGYASYLDSAAPEERDRLARENRTAVPRLEVDSAARGLYAPNQDLMQSAKILSVAVGLLLVIVCTNVASLLLSRAAVREKEIAVRVAMGASRWRLVRRFLTESVLLAMLGGILGLVVGYWGRRLLPFGQEAPLDWRVFTFAAVLCLTTGVACGLFPALRATRLDVSAPMKKTTRSVVRSRTFVGSAMLAAQVALSVIVLIGAGLFLRTLQNLRSVEVGFETQNLVVFNVVPRFNGYDAARIGMLYEQLHEELQGVPGVQSVSHSQSALLGGQTHRLPIYTEGMRATGDPGLATSLMTVSPEFLETMQIPLLRGRGIEARDTLPNAQQVGVINQAMAQKLFPTEDALGKRYSSPIDRNAGAQIVGIVADTKYTSVRAEAPPTLYQPFPRQSASAASFEVRVAADPVAMQNAIREAVRRTDPNLPIARMTTQAELVEGGFSQERLFALAYSLFGGLGLLLVSIGLFGLMSYNVAHRTNEIGIRMALGAQGVRVLKMILGESLVIVVIGILCGIAGALAAGRFVTSLLFGLAPTDPVTIFGAIAVMLTVALLAAYLPARRASRVDPLIALHHD